MNWQEQAESLCRSVLGHELAELPIYILSEVDAPNLACGGGCGITSIVLDAQLAPILKARGQWRGRGFGTVINEHDGSRRRAPRERLETALHELAHHLCSLTRAAPALTLAIEELPEWLLAEPKQQPDDVVEVLPDWVRPWHHHELAWIRAAAHIAHRATLADFPCRLSDLGVAGPHYGLSPADSYARAIGDEPREREAENLLAVLRSAAPERFEALFIRDTSKAAAA